MYKKLLILKSKDIKLIPYKRFFYIQTKYENRIVSYRYIKALYLHVDIEIDFKILLMLGGFFEVHRINTKGDIVIK